MPVDIYEASLAAARFDEGEREEPFIRYLDALFAEHRLDLIIAVGAPAAQFVQRHRQQIFPTTPMLLTGVEQRRVKDAVLTANDTVVAFSLELPALVSNILKVLPQTNQIAVVIGSSPNEKFWLAEMQHDFQPFAGRVKFIWMNRMSFGEIRQQVSGLPAQSAVLLGPFTVDGAGVPREGTEDLAGLREVSAAPIFGYVDTHFGRGIVGGPLISLAELSRQAAGAAFRILQGEPPSSIKANAIGLAPPTFDWRELRSWNISESDLPLGSRIEFRQPTIWQQYKWYILSGVAFSLVEAILILALLTNQMRLRRANVKRLQAESEAHELGGRLINAQEAERSRLARELHDDVTQRLAFLAIEATRGERNTNEEGAGILRNIREGLVRLSEDVHVLSRQLHPSILEDLGLAQALESECERLSQINQIGIATTIRGVPERLSRDVALCLFRIGQEGMRNIIRHAHASEAELRLEPMGGGLQMAIIDNGAGFDPAQAHAKARLGLESMRQRIFLLGGRIEIKSIPGYGTTILAWVPLREVANEPSARSDS